MLVRSISVRNRGRHRPARPTPTRRDGGREEGTVDRSTRRPRPRLRPGRVGRRRTRGRWARAPRYQPNQTPQKSDESLRRKGVIAAISCGPAPPNCGRGPAAERRADNERLAAARGGLPPLLPRIAVAAGCRQA